MIDKEYYNEMMTNAVLLMGVAMSPKRSNLIYERIKNSYDNADIDAALNDIAEGEGRFTFDLLMRKLNYYRSIRIDELMQRKKRKEEAEVRDFWKRAGSSIGECGGGKCGKCSVKFCDAITHAAQSAIINIIDGKVNYGAAMQQLAARFQGAGFEGEPF